MGFYNTTLILGGARSGKTAHALHLCETACQQSGLTPFYIATAQALDSEMTTRIQQHQAERGDHWQTYEAPFNLAATLTQEATAKRIILVDCLTLWLTNHLLKLSEMNETQTGSGIQPALDALTLELVAALNSASGPVVLVSNETGLGIVPDNALARQFRDAAGQLNQKIAAIAARVEFIAAGLPLILKGV